MSSRRPAARLAGWAIAVLALLVGGTACAARPGETSVPTSPISVPAPGNPTPTPTPGAAWTAVALGDSVTSGFGCPCAAFPQRYAEAAGRRYDATVTMHNQGSPGLTSARLLTTLTTDDSVESHLIRSADIDLITIGANDFGDDHDAVTSGSCTMAGDSDCTADELQQLATNVGAVITTIHQLRLGRATTILITGYWNVFEDGDVACSAYPAAGLLAAKRLTASVNLVIASAAQTFGARYVDLADPFTHATPDSDTTGLLEPDGDHPNAAGHALIAKSLLAAGLPGLRQVDDVDQ